MQSRIAERLFGEPPELQRIAHYEIIQRVGAGGMGVVYAARDTELGRVAALKLLRQTMVSELGRERLLQEARALAKLSHPNVVQVYGVGVHEADVYVAMEFIEGETLLDWQRRTSPSIRQILTAYLQAGGGLAAAHQAGIVHRDFKPANVLVGHDDRVRVVDFGLAVDDPITVPSMVDSSSESSALTTRIAGTPGYMAPEVHAGKRGDARSDQFSFCVALWEAIAGERPLVVRRLADLEHPEVPERRDPWPGPRWLEAVLRRGLASDPNRRWPSLRALLDELEQRPKRRRNRLITSVALAILAASATVALHVLGPQAPEICQAPRAELERVWNEQRRAQLSDRLRATELPDPESTVAIVSEAFEQFGRAWVAARARACADHEESARSSTHFDLANECLDRTLDKARTLLETIEHGDLEVQARIAELLAELGDPMQCNRSAELGPTLAPASLRSAVGHDSRILDNARIELAAGHFDAVQSKLDALESSDAVRGFAPLQAEFELTRGRLLAARQRFGEALDSFVAAAVLAEQHQLPKVLFEARREIVGVEAQFFEDEPSARRWLVLAAVPTQTLDNPAIRIELLEARAEVQVLGGQLARAETTLEEALRLAVASGSQDTERGLRLHLANVIAQRGRTTEALRMYEALEKDSKDALGGQHPAIGSLEFDIALAVFDLQQYDEARQHFEAALHIQEATYGSDNPKLAPVLTMLANVANYQHRYEDAITLAERAWAMQLRALPSGHSERGTALMALGWAQVQSGRLAEGLATHELLAVELEEQLDPLNAAYLQQTLGWLRCRVEGCRGAKPHFELALATGDELTKLQARLGLANVDLAEGRAGDAVEAIEALLPKLEAWPRSESPESAALAQWMLARALVESGESRSAARVRTLAEASQAAYRDLPPRSDIAEDLIQLLAPDHNPDLR